MDPCSLENPSRPIGPAGDKHCWYVTPLKKKKNARNPCVGFGAHRALLTAALSVDMQGPRFNVGGKVRATVADHDRVLLSSSSTCIQRVSRKRRQIKVDAHCGHLHRIQKYSAALRTERRWKSSKTCLASSQSTCCCPNALTVVTRQST